MHIPTVRRERAQVKCCRESAPPQKALLYACCCTSRRSTLCVSRMALEAHSYSSCNSYSWTGWATPWAHMPIGQSKHMCSSHVPSVRGHKNQDTLQARNGIPTQQHRTSRPRVSSPCGHAASRFHSRIKVHDRLTRYRLCGTTSAPPACACALG